MRIKIFYFFLFYCSIIDAQYSQLTDHINTWANDPVIIASNASVAVHDVNEGYLMAGYNFSKYMIPASSQKILSTLILLKKIGEDYRFPTVIGIQGDIADSVLVGNLHVIGSGDPSLGSKRFSEKPNFSQLLSYIVYKVKQQGIQSITGDIIIDQSRFELHSVSPTWEYGDIGRGYGTGSYGLNVHENEMDVWFNTSSGYGNIAYVTGTYPTIENYNLRSNVVIDNRDIETVLIYGEPDDFNKVASGTIPIHRQRIDGSIPNPPLFFGKKIKEELIKAGIAVNNVTVKNYKSYDNNVRPIDTIFSPRLAELVKQTNFQSLNLYADAFFKTLGELEGSRGNWTEGARAVKSYLATRGINSSGLRLEDGSGLSPRNLVTTQALSGFLASYAREEGFEKTCKYLPLAGKEGSVRRMLPDSPARGKVWMKSGSMSKVLSYTGLMETKNKRRVSFSIIVNNYDTENHEIRVRINNLIEDIYNSI
jgi:D-alanyl-D-alanine carboxypeptidase/D-alanyl-D-alanine-endopeptidase (penicillin-binding protein 4)